MTADAEMDRALRMGMPVRMSMGILSVVLLRLAAAAAAEGATILSYIFIWEAISPVSDTDDSASMDRGSSLGSLIMLLRLLLLWLLLLWLWLDIFPIGLSTTKNEDQSVDSSKEGIGRKRVSLLLSLLLLLLLLLCWSQQKHVGSLCYVVSESSLLGCLMTTAAME
jgi:hypothetical protein